MGIASSEDSIKRAWATCICFPGQYPMVKSDGEVGAPFFVAFGWLRLGFSYLYMLQWLVV